MAIDKKINIPFTVTGGLSTGLNGGVDTLSGYTNALTRFRVSIDPSSTYYNADPWLSNDTFVWDMGDGTTVKGTSAIHIYNYPGTYNISLVAFTSGGQEYLSTITKEVSVGNFLVDTLDLDTSDIIKVVNVPAASKVVPIKIRRQNSWQPHSALSGTGYTINLYASGSKSRELDVKRYNEFKWAHLDQTWAFFEPITANNGTVNYVPVRSVKTKEDEDLYYVAGETDASQTFTRVTSSYLASVPGVSAVFVGTSGSAEFFYVDDTPKLEDDPVFVFGYLDTSKFPSHRHLLDGNLTSFSSLKFFEHYGLTVPVRVKYNPAIDIKFTSSGIRSMPMSKIKYQSTEIPFFVGLGDAFEGLTENYPPLNVLPVSAGGVEAVTTYTVNLSTVSGSETTTSLLSTHYFKDTDTQLPSSLSGTFRGFLVPLESGDDVTLKGNMLIDDQPNFPKDVYLGYVTNNDHGDEIRLLLRNNYNINHTTGTLEKYKDVHVLTYKFSIDAASTLTNKEFPISVVSRNEDKNNNDVLAYIGNTTQDILSSLNAFNAHVSPYDIKTAFVTDAGQIQDILASYSTGGTNASTDPTSISVDVDRNIYVALPQLSLVEHISAVNGNVKDIFVNLENKTYNVVTSGENGINIVDDPAGVHNTYNPSIVEAGRDGTVWLAYTNPVSSFIRGYKNSQELISEYQFNQTLSVNDLKVDNKGNLWAAVQNKLRSLSGYKYEGDTNDYERSQIITGTGEGTKSDNQFKYILNTTSWPVSTGELVELSGFAGAGSDTKWYDGTYLTDSVSANPTKTSVTVTPYIGKYNQAASTTGSTTISATRRPSDRIYKFDATGTKLFSVSGFLNPTNIVVDKNQQLWVSHNTDTLTQLNTAGGNIRDINASTSSFIANFVSAGSDLTKAVATDGSIQAPLSADLHHIGALSLDTFDNLLVINSFENKLLIIPTNTPVPSTALYLGSDMSPISADHGFTYGRVHGLGDWTGYTWLNKYKNTTGVRTITGETTFSVFPSGGKNKILKVNENFDPRQVIKSYRFAPNLIEQNILFDDFIGTVVGTLSSDPNSLGRHIYEKIANFVPNTSDPDTCNVSALYSLCEMLQVDINNYNFNYPGRLKRVIDMVSIPHHKLWGDREKFDGDVDLRRVGALSNPANTGDELTMSTYVVSADQPIVAKQLYNSDYRKVVTGYISPYASSGWGSTTSPHYITKYGVVSAYPLSAYSPHWGWGLLNGVSGLDIQPFVKFFEYIAGFTNIHVEGIIDWGNPQTTLIESVSSIKEWEQDDGLVEQLLDFELRSGLDLFMTQLSGYTTGVL